MFVQRRSDNYTFILDQDSLMAVYISFHEMYRNDKATQEKLMKKILTALNGFGQRLGIDQLNLIKSCLCDNCKDTPEAAKLLDKRIEEISGF